MSTEKIPDDAYIPFGPDVNSLTGLSPRELEGEAREASMLQGCELPPCRYGGGRFEVGPKGVFLVPDDTEKKRVRVCAELRIEAETRDAQNHAWGRLLRWSDRDGKPHTWAMPNELLHGDSAEALRELSAGGLTMDPGLKNRELLLAYLQGWQTPHRARCVDRLGWHGEVYCTPEKTIGSSGAERVVFQPCGAMQAEHASLGTVDEWANTVGILSAGNSRLVLAVSIAFAGTLLALTGEDSGGLHLVGPSSCGKTTALRLAASVWGKPETYMRQWRATANGLEGLAAVHNDGLLCLDELSQCDARQAGETAYMLANGKGKARASRSGLARAAASWRLLFLSSGEVGIGELLASAGKRTNAGQEVRLVNVPADSGLWMGIFEDLHGYNSPAAFASALSSMATMQYGAVGLAWLELIVRDRTSLIPIITDGIAEFLAESVPQGASGQVTRVARRFGLIAAAGELASDYGLTGWKEGEAADGVAKCFQSWLGEFGIGNREDAGLLSQVRTFLEKHGVSRFQSIEAESGSAVVPNRAGFWRDKDGVRQYLVLPETFGSEVIGGFPKKRACEVLIAAKLLHRSKDRVTEENRLPGYQSPQWVYVLTSDSEAEA